MADNDKKHSDQFDASLPLPAADTPKPNTNAAADLVRKKVDAAYASEPDAAEEGQDLTDLGPEVKRTKHQQFIYELTTSGKSLEDVQTAWHEYYAALPEEQKMEVWQEFYATHEQASQLPLDTQADKLEQAAIKKLSKPPKTSSRQKIYKAKKRFSTRTDTDAAKTANPLHSIAFGLSVGVVVVIIFLFSFFNERFIAPFIQPSRDVSSTPIINTQAVVGPNPEVIIPKINVEIPVVYGVDTIDNNAVEKALERGVVHYADTAEPGQDGNVVIVGHSSNNIFNPGNYKFAFVLLSRLDTGDTFYLQKDGKRYTYQVYKKQIVSATDVSVLGPADKPATASLITCDPPGTSRNRLVVTGTQIDPDPTANAAPTTNALATQSSIIPGNSPSLWSRFTKWLSG